MEADALFTILIIWQVRRFLDTKNRLPDWDKWLRQYWIVVMVTIAFSSAIDQDLPLRTIWFAALGIFIYTVWLLNDDPIAQTLLRGLGPFMFLIAIGQVMAGIFPGFAKQYDAYYDAAKGLAIVWLIAFFFIARNQKKALQTLEAEREKERDVEASLRRLEAEQRQKAEQRKAELEAVVSERTAEIMKQKEELEQALTELKATQNQLIHSEKMASLGELTAGIAHEIQNPLNFVNNFAEVSVELIDELAEEQQKPDRDTELEADLLTDLKQNLQKISHHGSRASSIVRGMLQHSRASTGQREPTDLNALCDEYLRLAYHGLRAKDKTFNAQFSTDLDADLGKVTAIPQDLGRVLLNLFTNAFYAVQQRQKNLTAGPPGGLKDLQGLDKYQPTVTVQTRCEDGKAVIRVTDNGIGIPESAKQKIFQPFFTTKPTGEGTGLGLSLAYDIITEGHNGTLEVDSRDGEGTTFTILLPA